MTWDEAKINSDKLIKEIGNYLNMNPPRNIGDILKAVNKVDKDTGAIPNPNNEGQYCQLLLYPSKKWNTWNMTSMSISEYNIYK